MENFEEKFSKDDNFLMYGLQIGILQPSERAGRKHFVNFVIGTEEDPSAELPATWQEKGGHLKQFCKAVGVPLEGEDLDIVTQHVMKKNFCFRIEHRPGTGKYKGRWFVNVTKWAMEGTMAPGLDPIATAVEPTLAPVAAPVAPVAPVILPAAAAPAPPLTVVPPPVPPTATPPENPTPGTETESYPFPPPPGSAA